MQDPIQHLLDEHVEIMAEIAKLRTAVADLEARGEAALASARPALAAGGASLRGLTGAGAGAAELARTGAEIVRLLDLHFGKEEQILFPMCRDLLSPARSDEIARRMEAIAMEAPAGP